MHCLLTLFILLALAALPWAALVFLTNLAALRRRGRRPARGKP